MSIEKQENAKASELEMKYERYFGKEVAGTSRSTCTPSHFEIFTAFKPVRTVYTAGIGK